jgi:methylamine---glutamate N-methyltransferase subunit A
MCGIAGIIYRNGNGAHRLGADMTRMLQSMKHRGPDSTGYALYRPPTADLIMRIKLADGEANGDIDYVDRLRHRRREVAARLRAAGARVDSIEDINEYTIAASLDYDGELKRVADYVESVPGAEVLSAGSALEIVKDLGDAQTVGTQYKLDGYLGTHGIGHVRMATESDVDISNAHPYWAYPFSDVAVVHNGQLTNYHQWRRRLERMGHRFASDCDSEIIAVYLAQDALGMAKDELAAKPLVLYESDDMVVLASEEMAIRAVIDREIETYDPYESEVMVWTR